MQWMRVRGKFKCTFTYLTNGELKLNHIRFYFCLGQKSWWFRSTSNRFVDEVRKMFAESISTKNLWWLAVLQKFRTVKRISPGRRLERHILLHSSSSLLKNNTHFISFFTQKNRCICSSSMDRVVSIAMRLNTVPCAKLINFYCS